MSSRSSQSSIASLSFLRLGGDERGYDSEIRNTYTQWVASNRPSSGAHLGRLQARIHGRNRWRTWRLAGRSSGTNGPAFDVALRSTRMGLAV